MNVTNHRGPVNLVESREKVSGETTIPDRRINSVLISEKSIRNRVKELAKEICEDYQNTEIIHMVVLLKGAFIFAGDLGREIARCGGPEIQYDFIKPVTYGKSIKASGEPEREVRIEYALDAPDSDNILVVEDIVDQAYTLTTVREYLTEEKQARSVRFCVLLEKILQESSETVRRLREQLHLDYVGFRIPDKWVAGYGIDAGEDFRHLPCIVTVNEEYYK